MVLILDRYELRIGKNLKYFIEQAINEADRILIMFTPQYKVDKNMIVFGFAGKMEFQLKNNKYM